MCIRFFRVLACASKRRVSCKAEIISVLYEIFLSTHSRQNPLGKLISVFITERVIAHALSTDVESNEERAQLIEKWQKFTHELTNRRTRISHVHLSAPHAGDLIAELSRISCIELCRFICSVRVSLILSTIRLYGAVAWWRFIESRLRDRDRRHDWRRPDSSVWRNVINLEMLAGTRKAPRTSLALAVWYTCILYVYRHVTKSADGGCSKMMTAPDDCDVDDDADEGRRKEVGKEETLRDETRYEPRSDMCIYNLSVRYSQPPSRSRVVTRWFSAAHKKSRILVARTTFTLCHVLWQPLWYESSADHMVHLNLYRKSYLPEDISTKTTPPEKINPNNSTGKHLYPNDSIRKHLCSINGYLPEIISIQTTVPEDIFTKTRSPENISANTSLPEIKRMYQ